MDCSIRSDDAIQLRITDVSDRVRPCGWITVNLNPCCQIMGFLKPMKPWEDFDQHALFGIPALMNTEEVATDQGEGVATTAREILPS